MPVLAKEITKAREIAPPDMQPLEKRLLLLMGYFQFSNPHRLVRSIMSIYVLATRQVTEIERLRTALKHTVRK